jgi:hypothetical protein
VRITNLGHLTNEDFMGRLRVIENIMMTIFVGDKAHALKTRLSQRRVVEKSAAGEGGAGG